MHTNRPVRSLLGNNWKQVREENRSFMEWMQFQLEGEKEMRTGWIRDCEGRRAPVGEVSSGSSPDRRPIRRNQTSPGRSSLLTRNRGKLSDHDRLHLHLYTCRYTKNTVFKGSFEHSAILSLQSITTICTY